jgi:hydroxymethylpyrimidine/phosphomethylpyrimidine kinase
MASPGILIASGLDPSGGAGFIADVRGAERAGVRPIGVLTALTVQDTRGVRRAAAVDPELLAEQLACVLSDVEVTAVKIGLVADVATARILADALALTRAPVIWDPVVTATAGGSMTADSLGDLAAILGPESALVTPNLFEAAELLGRDVGASRATIGSDASLELASSLGCAVLLKGGHADGDEVVDIVARDGVTRELRYPRLGGPSIHGTGCFLSTAVAVEMARGLELDAAIDAARARLAEQLSGPVNPGRGAPAVL